MSDNTDQLFKNEKDLLDFINHSKSLATKVKDIWFAILDKLNISHKEDERSLWEKCYREASREAREGESSASGEVRYKYVGKTKKGIKKYETDFPKDMDFETRKKIFKERISTIFNLGAVELKTDIKKIKVLGDKFTAQKNIFGDEIASDLEIESKINSLYDIAEILSDSIYVGKNIEDSYLNPDMENVKKSHKGVKYWYKFKNTIYMDGEKFDVIFNIRDKGKNQYQYLIEFHNKGDNSNQPYGSNNLRRTLDELSPKKTVPQKSGSVNNYSMQNGEKNSPKERSRIFSAAEATRKNRESDNEYARLRGAIEQIKGKSEGGIVVNEHSIALKKRDITSYVGIQKMAQDLGMKAIIVKGLFEDSEQALDGIITPQGVFIDADAENPARFVATHEFSHRMKQAAAKDWKRYQEYVIKVLKKKTLAGTNKTAYDVLYDATRKAYGDKTDDYIHEEIAANHIGELFENEAELIDFIRTDRSLAQKVKAWWNNVLSMFGLNGEKEKAKAMWLRAYKKAVKNVQSGKVGEFGEERFAKTELNNSVDSDIISKDSTGDILAELLSSTSIKRIKMVEFPPYNKSRSEANQIATRWAHNEKIQIGDQAIVSYHGGFYVIEKFESADMKYQIAGRLSVKDYRAIIERMRQREKENKGNRTAKGVSDGYVAIYGKGNISKGRGDGVGGFTVEHSGEDTRVHDLGENKNSGRHSSDNSRGSDAYDSTNRKTQSGGDYGRKAVRGTRLSELVEEYGAIEPGAGPRRDVSVPKRTKDDNRVSRFARTAAEATTLYCMCKTIKLTVQHNKKIETSVMGNTILDNNQVSTYLLPVSDINIS